MRATGILYISFIVHLVLTIFVHEAQTQSVVGFAALAGFLMIMVIMLNRQNSSRPIVREISDDNSGSDIGSTFGVSPVTTTAAPTTTT